MAVLLNRIPLAALLVLAISRIACAEVTDLPPMETSQATEVDVVFPQSSRSQQMEPPLRLALALGSHRQARAPLVSATMQDADPLGFQGRQLGVVHPAPAISEIDNAVSRSSGSPYSTPALRMTLALNTQGLRAASAREMETAHLTPRRRSDRPNAPVNQQHTGNQPMEHVKTDHAPQQKQQDMANGDPVLTWEISAADKTLNTTLTRWASRAGWQLVWDLDVDFPIETRAVLQGTFEEAVATVAQSLAGANVPVQATFYEGNRVLRVIAKGSK